MLALFCFWACVFIVLPGCEAKPEATQLRLSGATMGTTYHINVITEGELPTEDWQQEIDLLLGGINDSMSTYIPDSELNQLNAAPVGEWLAVSKPLLDVLLISDQVSRLSSGAFDITLRPLIDLWGFGPVDSHDRIPATDDIKQGLRLVGYQKIKIDKEHGRILKQQPVSLDLSAVAKGYAVDKVAQYLLAKGVNNFLVEIGGELRLSGHNSSGTDWRIAIEKPDSILMSNVFKTLQLSNLGIATSGDYRNYFEVNGVRFSHTIDPRVGYPITHNLASVTVIDESAARADALATAFNVMGVDAALALADSENIRVLFIIKTDDKFEIVTSNAFRQQISIH